MLYEKTIQNIKFLNITEGYYLMKLLLNIDIIH